VTDLVSRGVARTRKGKRKRTRRREMLDLGWGELRRQLGYKCTWRGVEYVQTDGIVSHAHRVEGGPATDMPCHACGRENKMPDSTSRYKCEGCGNETTRQANTAWLLVDYGSGGEPTRSTGGDPGPEGREPERDSTRGLGSAAGGANVCMTTLPQGASKPPGGSRKRSNARKAEAGPRQTPRAKKTRGVTE
jgi:transposase